jgi:hypothetical protein
MNIALATLTLLIILYPGFLFRRFYYTGEFSKEYFKQSVPDLIFSSILPGFFIHFVGYLLFIKGRGEVDVVTIGTLLSGTSDSTKVTEAFKTVYQKAPFVTGYFLGVSLVGMAAGFTTKLIVRKLKLDRKVKLFRFQNEWHYIFSGEILDFPKVPGKAEDIDCSYVDALVKTDEGTVIYTGLLADYILTKEGGIDRIYLTDVKRRFFKDDLTKKAEHTIAEQPTGQDEGANDSRYYYLPGRFFIISYSQIINLHVTYYKVTPNQELKEEIKHVPSDDK